MNLSAPLFIFNPAGPGRILADRAVFSIDGRRGECAVFAGEHVGPGWFAARRGWEPWRIFEARALFGGAAAVTLGTVARQLESAEAEFWSRPCIGAR